MIRTGKLPVLASIMRTGAYGRLGTIEPTMSSIIWTSVATGKAPEKHGIVGLLEEDDSSRGVRLYSSADRRTKALWNIFSDYGLMVHSLGWWKTYPVEEISGVMVPQLNILFSFDGGGLGLFEEARPRGFQGLSHPEEFSDQVSSIALETDASLAGLARKIFGQFRHPHSGMGKYMVERIRWVLSMDAMHYRLADSILARKEPFDLMLVYFRGADVLGHATWRYTYPGAFEHAPTTAEIENYGDFIPRYYRFLDSAIGSILESAGSGATVLVVSDHGMEAANQDDSFSLQDAGTQIKSGDHKNAQPGVFLAAGPHIARTTVATRPLDEATTETLPLVGTIYDLAPTILALKGLPAGEDMDGRVMTELLDPEFLQQYQPSTVASHDSREWLESRPGHRFTMEQMQDRIQELRSLGYIE
jgi:predicted AlkP superfamily phosphohydrolase/phosphomutase